MRSTISAYTDCEEHFDSALESENGIAIDLETQGMATRLMQRLNTCRKLHRERSTTIYEPSDPNFGVSPWDALVVKRDPTCVTRILIAKQRTKVLGVTPL